MELNRKLAGLQANLEARPSEGATRKPSGDFSIKRWLEQQLRGRSCLVVLIGAETAARPWVQHEIKRARELKLGLLGVCVHQLADAQGRQSTKGVNPFALSKGEQAAIEDVYDPPETDPKLAYRFIADHPESWVDKDARIELRMHCRRLSATLLVSLRQACVRP